MRSTSLIARIIVDIADSVSLLSIVSYHISQSGSPIDHSFVC